MKTKALFLSMGLFACLAFSPKPAFAAPDTGPKVDNIEVSIISASADLIMPEQGSQVSINTDMSAFAQGASGQETVVHRSDHTGGNHYILNPALKMMTVSNSALAVDDRRRPCNSMIMNVNYRDLDPSKTAAGLPLVGAAQHSHQLVWVMKRPGWTVRYSRC